MSTAINLLDLPEQEYEDPNLRPSYSNGVPLVLTEAQKQLVLYSKYESQNKMITDVIHDQGIWEDELVANIGRANNPKIMVGERGVQFDDSYIIGVIGTPGGTVGMLGDRLFASEEEMEFWEEANDGKHIPRFNKWDFRVKYILKTDGLARREALRRTIEQQREEAQRQSVDHVNNILAMLAGGLAQNQTGQNTQTNLDTFLQDTSIDQLEDLIAQKKAEMLNGDQKGNKTRAS